MGPDIWGDAPITPPLKLLVRAELTRRMTQDEHRHPFRQRKHEVPALSTDGPGHDVDMRMHIEYPALICSTVFCNNRNL